MSGNRLLQKLNRLTSIVFENLIFDLVLLRGMLNVSWRTPGADGGRDIEGQFIATDLSEAISVQRWYVECKKYSHSLDWPTIYGKIAYADNHNADYLLIATTSFLTPRCKEEIARRENDRKRPVLRYWDGTSLENIVCRYPILLLKFGLDSGQTIEGESIFPLLKLSSKSIQSAYGSASLKKQIEPSLELSAAIVDLASARLKEQSKWGLKGCKRFLAERDAYSWVSVDDNVTIEQCDSYGLRALLSAVHFCFPNEEVHLKSSSEGHFEIPIQSRRISDVFYNCVVQIALWSNLEIIDRGDKVIVCVRENE